MGIDGIWNGEYSYDDNIGLACSFKGLCQDDPNVSFISAHASVLGTMTSKELFMVKQYPKTFAFDREGLLITGEQPHPEIYYMGAFSK